MLLHDGTYESLFWWNVLILTWVVFVLKCNGECLNAFNVMAVTKFCHLLNHSAILKCNNYVQLTVFECFYMMAVKKVFVQVKCIDPYLNSICVEI